MGFWAWSQAHAQQANSRLKASPCGGLERRATCSGCIFTRITQPVTGETSPFPRPAGKAVGAPPFHEVRFAHARLWAYPERTSRVVGPCGMLVANVVDKTLRR